MCWPALQIIITVHVAWETLARFQLGFGCSGEKCRMDACMIGWFIVVECVCFLVHACKQRCDDARDSDVFVPQAIVMTLLCILSSLLMPTGRYVSAFS
jgi:hypothetical protein